jgi:hypothetical protein
LSSDLSLNLCPNGKLFLIFHPIILQSLVNFRGKQERFSQFTNSIQFGKIENQFLTGYAMNSMAPYHFGLAPPFKMPTEAHWSVTWGRGTQHTPRSFQTRKPSADRRRCAGLGPPPLSLLPLQKGQCRPKFPFSVTFLCNAEVRNPAARR